MANVLFLGAGRRVELIERFKKRDHNTICYETSLAIPVVDHSWVTKGYNWSDPEIKNDLHNVIESQGIDLIVPCQDEAAALLWNLKLEKMSLTSAAATLCYDKKGIEIFMMDNFPDNYPYPVTWQAYIKKGRKGFGSNSISKEAFYFGQAYGDKEFVYQRFIQGTEFSVDAYFDKNSNYVDSVPRTRDRVSGGEVIESITVRDTELQELTKNIGEKLGVKGPANFQYIKDKYNCYYLIEINHRFGGGFTLSLEAGFRVIELIERDWLGQKLPEPYIPNSWKTTKLTRSFRDHFFQVGD